MQKRLLVNLLLLGTLGALIAVAVLEPGKEEPRTIYLTEIEDGTIDRLVLENKEKIGFEKREGHWWLVSPFAAPANDFRVRQLVEIAHAESEARYPLKPEELAKYELDHPKASLNFKETKLIFGGSEPIDMRRYVQIGETLHLVNDDFSHHLSARATDFVDKKLLPDEFRPSELFIPGLKATLGADGKWTVDPASTNPAGITELVNAWQTARAIDVKRIEQPVTGDVIRVAFKDHGPIEFVIVQREPDLQLARTDWGLQYQVAAESARSLLNIAPVPVPDATPAAPTDPAPGEGLEDDLDHEGETPGHDGDLGEPDEGMETEGTDIEDQESEQE